MLLSSTAVSTPRSAPAVPLRVLSWTADITFDVGRNACSLTSMPCAASVSNLDVDGTLTFDSQTIAVEFSPPASAPAITLDVNGAGTVIGIGTPQIGPSGLWFFSSPLQGNGFAWVQFNLPAGSVGANGQLFLQQCTNIGPIDDDPVCPANIATCDGVIGLRPGHNHPGTRTRIVVAGIRCALRRLVRAAASATSLKSLGWIEEPAARAGFFWRPSRVSSRHASAVSAADAAADDRAR